jgi:hypothetical protein
VREPHREIHHFRWRSDALSELRKTLSDLGGTDREVVLMRLANELDDHLDLGILFYADAERRLQLLDPLSVCVDLARDLGHHRLARALADAFAACRTATTTTGANRSHWHGSYLVAPASYRPRLRVRLRQWKAGKAAEAD